MIVLSVLAARVRPLARWRRDVTAALGAVAVEVGDHDAQDGRRRRCRRRTLQVNGALVACRSWMPDVDAPPAGDAAGERRGRACTISRGAEEDVDLLGRPSGADGATTMSLAGRREPPAARLTNATDGGRGDARQRSASGRRPCRAVGRVDLDRRRRRAGLAGRSPSTTAVSVRGGAGDVARDRVGAALYGLRSARCRPATRRRRT